MRFLFTLIILSILSIGFSSQNQEIIQEYLRKREDDLACQKIDTCLKQESQDIFCLWAKAEILRRKYRFKESEEILKNILLFQSDHVMSLITLVYIRYYYKDYQGAEKILNTLLRRKDLNNEQKGLVLLLLATVRSKELEGLGICRKFIVANEIKGLFKKAVNLAPNLAETHLGLGTFYLFAPKVVGGNVKKAKKELEIALRLAPKFANVHLRLAQVYKKLGDLRNYKFYLEKAKELDPENELILEETRNTPN